MNCSWNAYLNLLSPSLRNSADKFRENLLETRLRLDQPPQWVTASGVFRTREVISQKDLSFCINAASAYSPWSAATASSGFITAPAGHRLGLCGQTVTNGNEIQGIRHLTSICLRVARDFPGISKDALSLNGSILILGPPGAGKTTLLRDLIRQMSNVQKRTIAVVDERQEIFPLENNKHLFHPGDNTDVLSGCPKEKGIEAVLRNMTPQMIAVDEITSQEDCKALLHAGWCGVSLLATAHASSRQDMEYRSVYKPLVESGLFSTLIILAKDKTWRTERMELCQ